MLCVVLSGCGDRTAFREAVGQPGDTGSYGIEWYAGSVDSAFELARSQGTPVLLYWGADWCPPCNTLKAEVFNRREFIERSRLLVPVSLDGDDPGAQKLGERFDVYAYPNLIVLSPHGEESHAASAADLYLRAVPRSDGHRACGDAAGRCRVRRSVERLCHPLPTSVCWRTTLGAKTASGSCPQEHRPEALRNLQGRIP